MTVAETISPVENDTRLAEKIKRLQGLALYGLALLRAVWFNFDQPRMTLRLDDGEAQTGPTLALSLALG